MTQTPQDHHPGRNGLWRPVQIGPREQKSAGFKVKQRTQLCYFPDAPQRPCVSVSTSVKWGR